MNIFDTYAPKFINNSEEQVTDVEKKKLYQYLSDKYEIKNEVTIYKPLTSDIMEKAYQEFIEEEPSRIFLDQDTSKKEFTDYFKELEVEPVQLEEIVFLAHECKTNLGLSEDASFNFVKDNIFVAYDLKEESIDKAVDSLYERDNELSFVESVALTKYWENEFEDSFIELDRESDSKWLQEYTRNHFEELNQLEEDDLELHLVDDIEYSERTQILLEKEFLEPAAKQFNVSIDAVQNQFEKLYFDEYNENHIEAIEIIQNEMNTIKKEQEKNNDKPKLNFVKKDLDSNNKNIER